MCGVLEVLEVSEVLEVPEVLEGKSDERTKTAGEEQCLYRLGRVRHEPISRFRFNSTKLIGLIDRPDVMAISVRCT